MVFRVTNQMQQNTALRNIFRITEDLFRTNTEVATGKKINRPSDDPSGIRDALALHSSIARSNQFVRNINNNMQFPQSADAALNSIGLGLIRARELAIGAMSGTDTPATRVFAANEIDKIISQLFLSANTQVKNQFVFAGTSVRQAPFQLDASGSGAVYLGNTESFLLEIAKNETIEITRPGSEILGTDFNPAITTTTALADLNTGAGIVPGSFTITDRAGNMAAITVPGAGTLGTVITAINSSGINVTASVNSSGNGILLTDTSPTIVQPMTVLEVGTGTTAGSLGILGQADGNIQGQDLDPRATATALISDLNGGQGMTLSSVRIVNGAASATVNLSSASTLGDVITSINGSAANVTASLNSQGNALQVISNNPASVAVVTEVGGGDTANKLGIGGGRNVFTTLFKLKKALELDDTTGILTSLDNLKASENSINNSRADLGSLLRRMLDTNSTHDQDIVDQTSQLSIVEDTDLVKAVSDIQQLQFALEATLSTTARILQPSLLDFLR